MGFMGAVVEPAKLKDAGRAAGTAPSGPTATLIINTDAA